MKKAITFCILVFSLSTKAAVQIVNVADVQFSPATFSVAVGDIVRFVWLNGAHTSTSVTVPMGAATWNASLDGGVFGGMSQFDYTVTTEGSYTFQCTPHAGLGMTGSFTAAIALPIKLADFMVKSLDKGKVLASWKTLTEENSDYFLIERSEDGKKFNEVGRVNAAGNSNTVLNYGYTDQTINPQLRYLYYRLKTIDIGGKSAYSPILLLKMNSSNNKIIVRISPNPVMAGDHIELWFNADKTGKLLAQMYDAAGRLVYNTEMSAFTGVNFGHLHIHDLTKGIYFLKLSNGQNSESVRVVVTE